MRVVVVGRTSFLAGHIVAAARAEGLDTVLAGHADDLAAVIRGARAVVNCAITAEFRTAPYRAEDDFDLTVARMAHAAGAHATLLSTRRVYPRQARWNAVEEAPAGGDETLYGRNKAQSEAAVRAATGGACTIFRLSNIFGMEHQEGRRTFMAAMLASLRREGSIHFDMDPASRRDFLPVEVMAATIARHLRDPAHGIFNLGCGFPVSCGDMAAWLMEGFGGGRLVAEGPVRDEFFLNMDRTRTRFGFEMDPARLRQRCVAIGQALACEKS
jgi:nucleoside-diphosphate-sugar epimerase